MKVKMYYRGRIVLKGNSLGHQFLRIIKGKIVKELNFISTTRYGLGGLYEVELFDKGQLKVGKYLEEDIKDVELFEKWKLEDASAKAYYNEERQHKIFVNKRNKGMYDNMTIGELREKCKSQYLFRRLMLYAVMGGDL